MEVLYSDAHSMDKKMKLFQCSDPKTVQVRKGQKENTKVFILKFIPQMFIEFLLCASHSYGHP